MGKEKYRIKKRVFLNRDESMTAAAVAIVDDSSGRKGSNTEEWYGGVVELSFTDCYRKVTYDFYLGNQAGRDAAIYKARALAEVINAFVEALEDEIESIEARKSIKAKLKTAVGS